MKTWKTEAFTKTYGGRQVLDARSLDLSEDQIYVAIGANGSGKSTFARILAGAIATDAGRSAFHGARPASIGYMPQRPYPFRMSMEKNLRLAADDPARAEELMGALKLTNLRQAKAHKLSGGESARMALARVLMRPFDLLILDEPCASMDMESTKLTEGALRRYRDRYHPAILLITHSIQQARRLGDEVLFFHEGHLAETGRCPATLETPQTDALKHFLEFYG